MHPLYELELELIQTQMTQKPMLRAEVGMRVRCANMINSALALFAQGTRIPTSARSIGFCVIWVCISSSSSSINSLLALSLCVFLKSLSEIIAGLISGRNRACGVREAYSTANRWLSKLLDSTTNTKPATEVLVRRPAPPGIRPFLENKRPILNTGFYTKSGIH